MDTLRSLTTDSHAARPQPVRSAGWSAVFRVAAAALVAASLVACGATMSGTAQPDPAALASAAVGQVPTDLPTGPGQIPTEEGDSPAGPDATDVPAEPEVTEAPADPDATEAPAEPDVTEIPDDPTDFGDIPGFGELPADWPADVVLPEGAVVSFGFSDETGKTVLFSVPGVSVPDLGAYFESSLPAAGYAAGQTGEFGGLYSGTYTKDGVDVTVGIIDLDGDVTGTITITNS